MNDYVEYMCLLTSQGTSLALSPHDKSDYDAK